MEERENESGKWNEWKSMNGQFGGVFFFIIPWKKSQKKGGVEEGERIDHGQASDEPCP